MSWLPNKCLERMNSTVYPSRTFAAHVDAPPFGPRGCGRRMPSGDEGCTLYEIVQLGFAAQPRTRRAVGTQVQRIAFLALLLLIAGASTADDVFIDKGACPGEGCSYGESWVARGLVELRYGPDLSASVTGTVRPGEAVRTLTGEVHTIPGLYVVKRVVKRPGGDFAPGDEVLVYTYLGEGWFRIRHNGELKRADLGFSPWGGSSGDRCERDPNCLGFLERKLQFSWWIKVRTSEGVEGWVLDANAFDQPVDH